jgi:Type II secretion system (T2SS), protein M
MTGRDRIVLISLAAVAVLAAVWMLAVSPEQQRASKLAEEVSSAQTQLQSAEGQLANATVAQTKYESAYTAVVSLGKAVPASQEVPSLIYQLAQATGQKNVEFASITSGLGSGSGSSASSSAATAGFTQMPFTFVFNGTFTNLYDLFNQLDGFAQRTTAGDVLVSGRLLTVQGVKLSPASAESTSKTDGGKGEERLQGLITATAYVLPAGQTVTGGATPTGPAGATQPASAGASSSTNTPAVIGAHP